MELLELVEYEPTTRPFQCDWESCNKVCNLLHLVRYRTSFYLPRMTELQPQVRLATTLPNSHK